MVTIGARRRDIARAIRANPTTITIRRTRKVRSGGGFIEEPSQAGPFVVRIYLRRIATPQTAGGLIGTTRTEESWGMLADHLADIQAGQDVRDEFDAPAGRFRVKAVRPEIIDGEIAGYQCELEKVG